MGKGIRNVITPRRRVSLTKKRNFDRTIVISQPNSAASSAPPTSNANIRVVVRVRPPNLREQDENQRSVVKVVDDQMLIFDPKEEVQGFFFHGVQQKGRDFLKKAHKDMQFVFDKVFSQESITEDVFKNTTYSLIDTLMGGFNCSVFAYGATGAGKTFTMTGNAAHPGVTFLTMNELFRKKEELSQERNFELGITYLEVYNELVKDLLNPGPPLSLREDSKYGVTVAGIKLYEIKSPDELFSLLQQGNKNRTQHPTDANSESSRSHAVFQVYLKMTIKATKEIRTAKLSMIDLAGSERGSATGFVGARFTEGANINKSLLALGNCINSLADGLRHVPYRDSKLTRLLKDSLGGNCQTVMIANVSASSLTFEDTYNTLKYAKRAKKIKSSMKRNVVSVDMHVGHYAKLVEELRAEVAGLKAAAASENDARAAEERLSAEVARLEAEVVQLKGRLEEGRKVDNVANVELRKECDRLRGLLEDDDRSGEDEKVLEEFRQLISEKREYMERQSQLEKSESAMALRRLLKEEIDSRLSDVCTNSAEKREAHRKINTIIERFRRKETALKEDIEEMSDRTMDVDKRLRDIVDERPHLKRRLEAELLKLKCLKQKHYLQLEQKTSEVLLDDHEANAALLEKMSLALKSFYQLLQGHELLTPDMVTRYQDIGAVLQGRKNIKWGGEQGDSAAVGTADSVPTECSIRSVCNKRKIEENPSDPDVLDKTFSLPESAPAPATVLPAVAPESSAKPSKGGRAATPAHEQLMSKALKPSPVKRLIANPRRENVGFRRPFESNALSATKSLVTIKATSSFRGATSKAPTSTLKERPRFRR